MISHVLRDVLNITSCRIREEIGRRVVNGEVASVSRVRLFFAIMVGAITAAPTTLAAQSAEGQAAISGDQFIQSAFLVGEALDAGEGAEIYRGGSPVLLGIVSENEFLGHYAQKRAEAGPVRSRQWMSVDRAYVDGTTGSIPAGDYMTVRIIAFGDREVSSLDQVTFRFDEDNVWRLAGYATQPFNGREP